MKIHAQAVKGHLIVGIALILLSLGSLIASFLLNTKILPILVWGGAETRRYLEAWRNKQHA